MPINSFLYPGAKVTTVYEVDNSCRFNDGDSASMSKSSSSGDRRQFTISAWVKRCNLGAEHNIFHHHTLIYQQHYYYFDL